jgi:uncharacterized membrane protein YfcA
MHFVQILVLCFVAFIGSALNAVAGGGSFFTFPALIFTGVPVLNANATSTVSLWPGAFSSAYTLRKKLGVERKLLIQFVIVSLIGSIIGTTLLLLTPDKVLNKLVPFLLLGATLILIFRNQIQHRSAKYVGKNVALIIQFFIAIYGGYFGGGIGILMLATLSLIGYKEIIQMNSIKSFLGATINGIAVILFIVSGKVYWQEASFMLIAAIFGGVFGTLLLSKVRPVYMNRFIIFVGICLSLVFFYKEYIK